MNLLIGGAGLIGSHVSKLVPSLVLDNLYRGSRENVSCDFIEADVRESYLLDALVDRSDCVFFFAAIPVLECDDNPEMAREVMVDALENVAFSCKSYGKRLVYSSSGSVYGEQTGEIREDAPLYGNTLYAKLKIEAEGVLNDIQPDFVGLRYQSVYGPARQSGYRAVINKFLECEGKLPVYGDGSQSYDFIHVKDVARANVLAMTRGEGFYNVCTGRSTSIRKLAEMIGPYEFVDGYTPIKHMLGNPDKAERELGFRYEIPLKEGLCAV